MNWKMNPMQIEGDELDYWVARAEGLTEWQGQHMSLEEWQAFNRTYMPTSNWAQAGPIIAREEIDLHHQKGYVEAVKFMPNYEVIAVSGKNDLEAAMRCFITIKLKEKNPYESNP